MRNLAARTGEFNVDIRHGLSDILGSLKDVGGRIEAATHIDMSIAEKSHATVIELGQELLALTDKARSHSNEITAVTEKMHQMTQEGVMAMQFEDIVSQMITRISQRTKHVGSYMHAFLNLHHDQTQTDGIQRFRTRSLFLRFVIRHEAMSIDISQQAAIATTALGHQNAFAVGG